MKSKKIGKIYDGRWKCIDIEHTSKNYYRFLLENIYNHEIIRVSRETMVKVDRGYSISKVYSMKNKIERKGKVIRF